MVRTPRIHTLSLCAAVLVLQAIGSIAATAAKPERPNIVYLMTDDQTDVATGCYGNSQVKTPNMDRLGADGLIFNNHYNTTAICMASRVCVDDGHVRIQARLQLHARQPA